MRLLFELGHPAHVHQFKNTIRNLEQKGHQVKICAIDKEFTLYLLNKYGFEFELLGKNYGNLFEKINLILKSQYKMLDVAKKFKPDLFISRGSPISAYISRIFKCPHIAFYDTEHAKLVDSITSPMTDLICTPLCFKRNLGKKQLKYNGYHELAYLNPKYFKPNSSILDEFGLSKGDYVFLRFVSWKANHDVGHHGIEQKQDFISRLGNHKQIIISSENKLDRNLEKYSIKFPPEYIHNILYYAYLYVGEGATMATESAVLGTPSIYISSLAGTMGNLEELELKYDLLYNFNTEGEAIKKALTLIENPKIKNIWEEKRKSLFKEKIDVSAFMTWLIELYPESVKEWRENQVADLRAFEE